MLSVYETRRANLRRLTRQWGGPTSLAKKLGHANGSYLAQLIGPHPTREISEKVARDIEGRLGLPLGWIDTEQGDVPALDDETLATCVRVVSEGIRDANLRPAPDVMATIVALVYDRWRITGQLDEPYLKRLLSLVKGK